MCRRCLWWTATYSSWSIWFQGFHRGRRRLDWRGRIQSALYMIDGVNNTRGGLGTTSIEMSPPVDSIQEFKVEVNGYGAEFGHTASGVLNAVTKGGTNQVRGNLY